MAGAGFLRSCSGAKRSKCSPTALYPSSSIAHLVPGCRLHISRHLDYSFIEARRPSVTIGTLCELSEVQAAPSRRLRSLTRPRDVVTTTPQDWLRRKAEYRTGSHPIIHRALSPPPMRSSPRDR